jgi:hypothetical protein
LFFFFGKVHERYVTRLRKKLQFEERKQSNQRRVMILLVIYVIDVEIESELEWRYEVKIQMCCPFLFMCFEWIIACQ